MSRSDRPASAAVSPCRGTRLLPPEAEHMLFDFFPSKPYPQGPVAFAVRALHPSPPHTYPAPSGSCRKSKGTTHKYLPSAGVHEVPEMFERMKVFKENDLALRHQKFNGFTDSQLHFFPRRDLHAVEGRRAARSTQLGRLTGQAQGTAVHPHPTWGP